MKRCQEILCFKEWNFPTILKNLRNGFHLLWKTVQSDEPMAATKIDSGTDVNFGALTRLMFEHLKNKNVEINYKHSVEDIKRYNDGHVGSKSTRYG